MEWAIPNGSDLRHGYEGTSLYLVFRDHSGRQLSIQYLYDKTLEAIVLGPQPATMWFDPDWVQAIIHWGVHAETQVQALSE